MKQRRPDVPWPFPGDTELDKARRVARDYRTELMRVAPEVCARMDDAARRLGQGWVAPELATMNLGSYYSASQLAEYIGVQVTTVYQWASRGHITRARDRRGRRVYLLQEVLDYHASLRQHRMDRHAG